MNRTHRTPSDFSDLPTAYFAVPALLWALAFVVALLGAPKFEGAASTASGSSTPAVTPT